MIRSTGKRSKLRATSVAAAPSAGHSHGSLIGADRTALLILLASSEELQSAVAGLSGRKSGGSIVSTKGTQCEPIRLHPYVSIK